MVELKAYDFGGQDVYYAMHHLFLSDAWQRTTRQVVHLSKVRAHTDSI